MWLRKHRADLYWCCLTMALFPIWVFVAGDCPVHCRLSSSILGLSRWMPAAPKLWQPKIPTDNAKYPPVGKITRNRGPMPTLDGHLYLASSPRVTICSLRKTCSLHSANFQFKRRTHAETTFNLTTRVRWINKSTCVPAQLPLYLSQTHTDHSTRPLLQTLRLITRPPHDLCVLDSDDILVNLLAWSL